MLQADRDIIANGFGVNVVLGNKSLFGPPVDGWSEQEISL